jgi:hypothetical protein
MTGKVIAIIAGIVALISTSLHAQDYALSELTNDTSFASISTANLTPKPIEVGQLPSSYLHPNETSVIATQTSEEVPSASYGVANLAGLVGFTVLMALGGTITSLNIFTRRNSPISPMCTHRELWVLN